MHVWSSGNKAFLSRLSNHIGSLVRWLTQPSESRLRSGFCLQKLGTLLCFVYIHFGTLNYDLQKVLGSLVSILKRNWFCHSFFLSLDFLSVVVFWPSEWIANCFLVSSTRHLWAVWVPLKICWVLLSFLIARPCSYFNQNFLSSCWIGIL